ncbi:MAG TPA: sulfite exporter TauE/SafE family protein [Phnomibacter sp.]|nr:sulfite exporter TauE/SafE family protein [Phnomibacter sp.]
MIQLVRMRHIGMAIVGLKAILVVAFLWYVAPHIHLTTLGTDPKFLLFIGVGFLAQMVDGALGMAYGASCTTLLFHLGVPPRVATAAVHTAEVFTTGVSGLSHIRFQNIDKQLFFRIVITGVIGAMLGAYIISELLDGNKVKPYIAGYLFLLGSLILFKGIRNRLKDVKEVKHAGRLAFVGGLLDAIGGGGWGPIVTSNLINQGKDPRQAIGTVNTAEFFVTFASTGVFLFFVGVESWPVVLGLIAGGMLAAPLGAYMASRINRRILMIMVGVLVMVLSIITLVNALG